ncbi:MAG: DUF4169 family protein [Primorskyibacter sp.]
MSTVVSLSKARKARARTDKQRTGAENAAKFGRTKAERARDTQQDTRATRHLDGHKVETAPPHPSDDTT